jgi:hypothetical protein
MHGFAVDECAVSACVFCHHILVLFSVMLIDYLIIHITITTKSPVYFQIDLTIAPTVFDPRSRIPFKSSVEKFEFMAVRGDH